MKKILAIKSRRLGDTVLWTASLQALIDLDFSVDVLYPKAYQALFSDDPRFSAQYFIEDGNIPKSTYDAVLCFHASPSSEKLARKIPAETRVTHYHSRTAKTGASTVQIPSLGVPMKATERDLNVVRALGWSGKAPATKLFVDEKRRTAFRKLFEKKDKPWVLLGPESSRSAKEWPLEYYVELAQQLQHRYSIGFFAENLEKVRTDFRYIELSKTALHLPTPSLDQLLGAMSFAHLFIGGDSGLKHIAVALGVRTITLFGPESIGEWHCYDGHTALQVPVGCRDQDPDPPDFSWCAAEYCPLASHACLRLIRPEDVVKVV